MFAFHRPKVYRSPTGCCICKAKSSSSRFTDSKKYEQDFMECFLLSSPRQGEICNACVLLVKRWKKLPAGSDRNWRHVVDARAGPGMKSMTKCKSKHKKQMENAVRNDIEVVAPKKRKSFEHELSPTLYDDEDFENGRMSGGSSRTSSPGGSDCEDVVTVRPPSSRRLKAPAKKRQQGPVISDFIDTNYWRKTKICCGYIFEGANGDILVDKQLFTPCKARQCMMTASADVSKSPETTSPSASPPSATKSDIDSSSDSGYDESSNSASSTIASAIDETDKPATFVTPAIISTAVVVMGNAPAVPTQSIKSTNITSENEIPKN